jgi:hypothetical protein
MQWGPIVEFPCPLRTVLYCYANNGEKGEYCCVSVATVVTRTPRSATYVHRLSRSASEGLTTLCSLHTSLKVGYHSFICLIMHV